MADLAERVGLHGFDQGREQVLAAARGGLQRGQSVGTLRVSLANGAPVAELPLQVLETVEEAGLLGRAWDALRLWIQ